MLDLSQPAPHPIQPLKVMLGTPSGGLVTECYLECYTNLLGAMDPDKVQVVRQMCMGSNIAENQNTIVDCAEDWGADYILFVESDNGFPANGLARLLSHGKDIVGATYQYKEHDLLADLVNGKPRLPRYMGYELDGSEFTLQGLRDGDPLRKVAGVPTGFVLISMAAIATVRAHIATKSPPPEGVNAPVFVHPIAYGAGKRRGVIGTTDLGFCGNAREAGLDVWLDARLSLEMQHVGTMNFCLGSAA